MIRRLRTAALFAIYQLTVLVGIVLMPVALLARRIGLTFPYGRAVARLGETYEQTRERRAG